MKRASMDVRFVWFTPEHGHKWTRAGRLIPKFDGPWGLLRPNPPGTWMYQPHPGLFRDLSKLDIADEKAMKVYIRAFADKYGDIVAQPKEGSLSLDTRIVTRKHATFEQWCEAIRHMRRAVDLWDFINNPKTHKKLCPTFVHSEGLITSLRSHHPRERRTSFLEIARGKDLSEYPPSNKVRLASRALRLEIDEALQDSEIPSYATPRLTKDLQLVIGPLNLLAHMWLTFARVVSGEIEERRCAICKENYLYVGSGPGLCRGDVVMCGAACRKRKQRHGAAGL